MGLLGLVSLPFAIAWVLIRGFFLLLHFFTGWGVAAFHLVVCPGWSYQGYPPETPYKVGGRTHNYMCGDHPDWRIRETYKYVEFFGML